jgi:hypothetical protein
LHNYSNKKPDVVLNTRLVIWLIAVEQFSGAANKHLFPLREIISQKQQAV